MTWQPIKTAPEGIDVIVYCSGAAIPVRIAMFCEGQWLDTSCNKLHMFPPTHWKPAPEPPK